MMERRAFLLGAAPLIAGCVSEGRRPTVPAAFSLSGRDTFLGLNNARFVVGARDPDIEAEWFRTERRRIALGFSGDYHMLALSGGGEDGAFGAGLMYGWSERGDRPLFDMITGVSTGALMAPLIFLGRDYDEALKSLYTTISEEDITRRRPLISALLGDAFSDTAPLAQLIDQRLTDDMIRAIGAEYRKGRFLLIGTTNLDLGRQVIWNIGAIAESGHPAAYSSIRRILLASASIPGLFPPVLFDIEVDGKSLQELHVDGATVTQFFLYPAGLTVRSAPAEIRRRKRFAWVIRNGRLREMPAETPRALLDITTRALSTLVGSNSLGDMYRTYAQTQRDKIDFNLAYIRGGFDKRAPKPFDTAYMNELFEFGRRRVREGRIWSKTPPGFTT